LTHQPTLDWKNPQNSNLQAPCAPLEISHPIPKRFLSTSRPHSAAPPIHIQPRPEWTTWKFFRYSIFIFIVHCVVREQAEDN